MATNAKQAIPSRGDDIPLGGVFDESPTVSLMDPTIVQLSLKDADTIASLFTEGTGSVNLLGGVGREVKKLLPFINQLLLTKSQTQ